MAKIELETALSMNVRTSPIHTGAVIPQGIGLSLTPLSSLGEFSHLSNRQDFDVVEMSLSKVLSDCGHGDNTWIALPVFTERCFTHMHLLVSKGSSITEPNDLVGKRIGVSGYFDISAFWVRAFLLHDYGVGPEAIHWLTSGLDEGSGAAIERDPPSGIDVTNPAVDLRTMLQSGEIDALITTASDERDPDEGSAGTSTLDRSSRCLFDDPRKESTRYFKETGLYPMLQCVVIRRELIDENPWIALNLYSMFVQAKQVAARDVQSSMSSYRTVGLIDELISKAMAVDLFPYGVKNQHANLELVVAYAVEQGLIDSHIGVGDIFYRATLDL